jgi:hypothetical protein
MRGVLDMATLEKGIEWYSRGHHLVGTEYCDNEHIRSA